MIAETLLILALLDNPFCDQAGARPGPDSPALAKNWTPESGLEPPPWYDIDGNQIEYLGACAPVAQQQTSTVKPSSPSLGVVNQ